MHVAHVQAICPKPPIHSVTGDMNNLQILSRPEYEHVMFFTKIYGEAIICGYRILTEGFLVTEASNNAGISKWRIVWVTTNCCLHGRCTPIINRLYFTLI